MSIEARIAGIQADLDSLKSDLDTQSQGSGTVVDSPEIRSAAQALAQAVAKAQGIDLPLRIAEGSAGLPVIELPSEFTNQGGIGIAVVAAAPPQ